MIDTVIFDVGNVLIEVFNDETKDDISRTLKVERRIVDEIWRKLVPDYLGKGVITEKEFWGSFYKLTQCKEKLPEENLLSRAYWNKFTLLEKSNNIVKALKKAGYKLGIISDTIPSHAEVSRKHNLFTPFNVVILSCEVGLRKPDPRIFRLALSRLKSKPESTIYTDDVEEYVLMARKLGMKGILFKNQDKFPGQLKRAGIKNI